MGGQHGQTARSLGTLAVMAKAPRPGWAKTRLVPRLGPARAAALYLAFLRDKLAAAARVEARLALVCPSDADRELLADLLPPRLTVIVQQGGGLMHGLASGFEQLCGASPGPVILIDGDSPTLPVDYLRLAFARLQDQDLVLGPTEDGGYYLVGAWRPHRALFVGPSYCSERICAQTREQAHALGLRVALLPAWYDVDTPEDLDRLRAELSRDGQHAPATAELLASWATAGII